MVNYLPSENVSGNRGKIQESCNALDNVSFYEGDNNVELLQKADVLLCDSSSIIIEFLFFDKPVVTYKNTSRGIILSM